MRWAVIALCLLLVPGAALTGEHGSTWADARAAIASGEVHEVWLRADPDSGARAAGQLGWATGWGTTFADVDTSEVDAVAGVPDDPAEQGGVGLQRRVSDWVTTVHPGVTVQSVPSIGGSASVLGWRVPDWLAWVGLALTVASLLLLRYGPEPRLATRWAWFWSLSVVPPLGLAAYLLLGARDARPDDVQLTRTGRLTGGWAFLWTSVISTIVTNAF